MSEEEILKLFNDNVIACCCGYEYDKAIQGIMDLYKAEKEKNARLTKDNLDLNMLYRRTASHFQEKEKFELADYMLVQIGAVPTWTDFEDYSNWINKDKIEAKLEELESIYKQEVKQKYNGNYYQQLKYTIQVLQELLKEEK